MATVLGRAWRLMRGQPHKDFRHACQQLAQRAATKVEQTSAVSPNAQRQALRVMASIVDVVLWCVCVPVVPWLEVLEQGAILTGDDFDQVQAARVQSSISISRFA